MTREYPWYEVVPGGSGLEQGDFVDECPVVIPPAEITTEPEITVEFYNVVILTQSCDLENRKAEFVVVCPVWPLSDVRNRDDFLRSRGGLSALLQGNQPGYHVLNRCDLDGFRRDPMAVDFRKVFSVHIQTLAALAERKEQRLRLLPPYREHLSQAFARFFMRVGLPVPVTP
jgi:hypothetical protein